MLKHSMVEYSVEGFACRFSYLVERNFSKHNVNRIADIYESLYFLNKIKKLEVTH